MEEYKNDYLDRVIAAMVFIVFIIVMLCAAKVVFVYWWFFSWLFSGLVVILCVWIVSMLFNIIWRYNANTQAILEKANIPLQLSQKKPPIYDYSERIGVDYNDLFAQEEDEE